MNWIAEHLNEVLTWLGVPSAGLAGWIIRARREKAERESMEVQTLRSTIEALNQVNETLRINIDELQEDIRVLKQEFHAKCELMEKEISELKKKVNNGTYT